MSALFFVFIHTEFQEEGEGFVFHQHNKRSLKEKQSSFMIYTYILTSCVIHLSLIYLQQ